MESRVNMRLFVVWLILVGITVAYLAIDRAANDHGFATASTAVTVAAICLALVKVRIIMREFMEVRTAPPVLRRLTDYWIVLMAAALLGVYLAGKAVA